MKPANIKDTKKSKGTARVKMLFRAHLYWLQGFPLFENGAVVWYCPFTKDTEKRRVSVNAKMISKTTRTINELQREYPIALPEVVGDVNIWAERTKQYLEHVKTVLSSINSNEDPGLISLFGIDSGHRVINTKKTSRQDAAGNYVLAALSWIHFIDRENLKPSLKALDAHAKELGSIAEKNRVAAIELVNIYSIEGELTQELIQLVADFYKIAVPTNGVKDFVQPFSTIKITAKNTKKKNLENLERPGSVEIQHIYDFVGWLNRAKSNQRKKALQFLHLIKIQEALFVWNQWWKKVDPIIEKIITNTKYLNEFKYESIYKFQGDLSRLVNNIPDELYLEIVLNRICCLSSDDKLGSTILNAINLISESSVTQSKNLEWFNHFHYIYHEYPENRKLIGVYIDSLAKYFKKSKRTKSAAPWESLNSYYGTPEGELLYILNVKQVPVFFNVLHKVNEKAFRSVQSGELEALAYCVTSGIAAERVVEIGTRLLNAGILSDLEKVVTDICAHLNATDIYAEKLLRLYKRLENDLRSVHVMWVCFNTLKELGHVDLFGVIVELDMFKEMVPTCYQLQVIQKTGDLSLVTPGESPKGESEPWMNLYPEVLKFNLLHLKGLTGLDEEKFKKMTSKYWWPKEFIQQEINTIERQLAAVQTEQRKNLEKRLKNYQSNLENHSPISVEKTLRLSEKLEHTIAIEKIRQWKYRVNVYFKKCWAGYFNLDQEEAPSWLYENDRVIQFLPIVDLENAPRKLAIRIINARCSNSEVKFTDEPGNMKFINRIKKMGIDGDKWIRGIGPRTYMAEPSVPVNIDVSHDPLETVNMGGHFRTCLSPGHFNFFSVFANIIDSNKQVIYGRNADGKVIGRVLVGMTDSGGIKVFYRYFHDKKYRFEEFVMEYIKEWVEQLGTILVSNGEIKKLVAHDWYDDGSIVVDSGIECLSEGSDLRQKMTTLPPESVIIEIEKQLSPLAINELTFPMIIQLSEIKGNTPLTRALINYAKDIEGLDDRTIVALFHLSVDNGCAQHCYSVFNRVLFRGLEHQPYENHYYLDEMLASALVDFNPAGVLKLINRAKRNKYFHLTSGIRSVGVEALKKLGRQVQAERLQKAKISYWVN